MFQIFDYLYKLTMPKAKQENKNCCQDHTFRLKPLEQDCYLQQTIKLKFCSANGKTGSSSAKKGYEGPIFNKDKTSSTPAFILKSEKDKYKSNLSNDYAQKFFNIAESKSQLLMPKPSSKSFYCNVCKQKYEDYRQHIETNKHKNKIKSNSFNRHIIKLCSKYEKTRNYREKIKQTNLPTLSELSNLIVIDQQSIDINQLSRPRKLVKMQQNNAETKPYLPQLQAQFYGNCFQPQHSLIDRQRIEQYYNAFPQFMNFQSHNPYYQPQSYYPMMQVQQKSQKNPNKGLDGAPCLHQNPNINLNLYYNPIVHPYPIPPLYPPQYMHPYMFGNGFPFPSTAQRFPEFNNREGGFSNLVMNNYVCKNSNTNRELNKSLRGANKKRFQHQKSHQKLIIIDEN